MLVHKRPPDRGPDRGDVSIVNGDAHDAPVVERLLDGVDMVISTFGSAEAPIADVSSTAVRHVVTAMRTYGIERIVSVTGSATRLDSKSVGSIPGKPFVDRC